MAENEADNTGAIKNHVPDKEISQITLSNLQEYDDAARVARTGVPNDPTMIPKDRNERVENRVAALRKMIGFQAHIISCNNMATIRTNCYHNWKKKYKTEEEKKDHPFKEEKNDINSWKELLEDLEEFEKMMDKAEMTPSLKDDYIWQQEDSHGNLRKVLTPNFYDMFNELINSYREIYGCLINHKIVTLGVSDDVDNTEAEKENESRRRILNA